MSNTSLTLDDLHRQLKMAVEHKKYHTADFFKPVPKQLEFIGLTKDKSESMLMAGNGCGKTETAAFMVKTWMTGDYPDWWNGYRFDGPVRVWAAGDSAKGAREGCQTKLLGKSGLDETLGTGMIPRERLIGKPTPTRGVADSVDSFMVRHKGGGVSRCVFKTYTQEREDWQGADIDIMWFDEEPPPKIHSEGQSRRRGLGRSIMTFTPLHGMTEIVKRYTDEEDPHRAYVKMGVKDALWKTQEAIDSQFASLMPHERDARMNGDPFAGEGRVFEAPRDLIAGDMLQLHHVPLDWRKIWGIDFGINGFAAVLLAHDAERDHYYVLAATKIADQLPLAHALAIKQIASQVPVAWPMDGHSRDRMGSGAETASIYRSHGLNLLKEHATHKSGGVAVLPGLRELDEVMRAGRFHVDRRLLQWFSEYDRYHFDEGKLVKKDDHLMDATRYAWMMRRKMRAVPLGNVEDQPRRRLPTGQRLDPWTGKATLTYG